MTTAGRAYIVSKQELNWLLDCFHQLLCEKAAMGNYGCLNLVSACKSCGEIASPAESNAADALWLVLLVRISQQAVQLQQLGAVGVLVLPRHEICVVSVGSIVYILIPGVAVEDVRKKHKKPLLSQLISKQPTQQAYIAGGPPARSQ